MSIFTTILTFIGCKTKEEKYLKDHEVIFCKTTEFEQFVENSEIKPIEARKLMIDFVKRKNQVVQSKMYFVVDGYYTFTNYIHPKIPEVYTGNIWVNSKTGEVKEMNHGIFIRAYNEYDW